MLSYSLLDPNFQNARLNVSVLNNKYIFGYPCKSPDSCTDYVINFSPGVYKFELYGASGGSSSDQTPSYRYPDGSSISEELVRQAQGNTVPSDQGSLGGSGGYVSGIILITQKLKAFATIGGKGQYKYIIERYATDDCYLPQNMIPGGYGGGGRAGNLFYDSNSWGSGSGGGQTAVKFEENDLWHRVIVSGGGGGSDDRGGLPLQINDGTGGAGGNLTAQGWFSSTGYVNDYLANSTFGFTFGTGESARKDKSANPRGVQNGSGWSDKAGAGGGWFGGFASHDGDAGSGGGSSWVLTKEAEIPKGEITATDSFFQNPRSSEYAFTKADYIFHEVVHIPGVWSGNGKLVISFVSYLPCPTVKSYYSYNVLSYISVFILIDTK